MQTVILAGGYGTRLSEMTHEIPKPMVEIGEKPLLFHLLEYFSSYGHKEFIIALGYKAEYIREYFSNYLLRNSDFTVDLSNGKVELHKKSSQNWKVTLIDTGMNSLTGRRLKLLEPYLSCRFFLTYGDGLSDVNLSHLLQHHESCKVNCTLTAVRPNARFGELDIHPDGYVRSFEEKPQLSQGWINGGFWVVEKEFLSYIPESNVMLEREPLSNAVAKSDLAAYKHDGFWQCVDTKRDYIRINEIYNSGKAPWQRTK